MNRFGRFAVYLGILMIAAGLIIGFGAMFRNADGNAIMWLGVVPVGFLVLLVGTVISQLYRREDDDA